MNQVNDHYRDLRYARHPEPCPRIAPACKLRKNGTGAFAKMKNGEAVLRILSANEAKIKGFGVRSLSLFGSSVRGEDTPRGDLDFIVELEKKSFDSYMDLKLFLEELFGRPVDLVLADSIKPRLRAEILREAIHAPGF